MSAHETISFDEVRRIGQARRSCGDHAGALECFRAAETVDAGERGNRNDIALCLLQLGRDGEAETVAQSLAAAAPDFAPVHRTLGLLARARHDREAARVHFASALLRDGRDLWSRHDLAVELKELGRLDEAETSYRAVVSGTPIAHSIRGMGYIARARGDRGQALARFRAALLLMPDDPWFALDVAVELRAIGRLDEADEALATLIEAHVAFVPALRERAGLAVERGDVKGARLHLGAAIAIAPDDVALRCEFADALIKLGQSDEAEAILLSILVQRPGQFEAYRSLASIARKRGEREIAASHLKAAVAARPGDASLRAESATELLAIGRTAEAEEAARAALSLDRECYGAKRILVLAAKASGRTAAALALAWEFWRQDEAPAAAGFDLAHDLREVGRWDLARRIYEDLGRRETVAVPAFIELASCLRRVDGIETARQAIEEARRRDPDNPRILLILADDRREAGDLEAADSLYDAALARRPGFYWALVGKGIARLRRGDGEMGRFWLVRAIEADPGEGYAQIELARELLACGEAEAACRTISTVPAHCARAADAAMIVGHAHRLAGNFSSAAEAFGAVATAFPGHAEALVEQAEDEARAGHYAEATNLIARLERQAPHHPAVLEALARRALVPDDLDLALTFYKRAAAADPMRLSALLGQARVEAMRGNTAAAMALYDAAERRFGARAEIGSARADLLRQTGDIAAGRLVLATARSLFPDHGSLIHQEIVAAIDSGEFAAAERAIAALPKQRIADAGRADFALSLLHAARWDFGAAVLAGERAVAAAPGDGWVRNRLIHASLLDLDLERAEHHLRRLAELEASANRLRGKSANMSQSHYGQIFDDFRIDADVLEALQTAKRLTPGERTARHLAIVGDHPDSTAAAILAFVALRREGRLTAFPIEGSPVSTIPRRIHQYWDGKTIPNDVMGYMATWTAAHPGFVHHVWSDETARAYLLRHGPAETLSAYDRAAEPAMKADLFRLALLYQVGGVYADADDRCTASLAPLIDRGRDLVVYQEDLGSLGNNVIAARPRNRIIGRALHLATEAVNRGDSDILWLSTGPGLLTRAAAAIVAGEPRELDRMLILERHEILAHVAIHCLAGYKATERHWSRTAFGRTKPSGQRQATLARSGAVSA